MKPASSKLKMTDLTSFFSDRALPLGEQDGFCIGDPHDRLRGVLVCFTATLDAIRAAQSAGCNLMIVHERIFFPTDYSGGLLEKHLCDRVNLPRIQALAQAGITVFRARRCWKCLLCAARWRKPCCCRLRIRLESLYPVDETTAGDFCRWTIERLKLPSVRFCGNENKRVRSVAVLNGGEGITRDGRLYAGRFTPGA